MKGKYVLDTFAVLAYLNAEPGGARTRELFEAGAVGAAQVMMSLVNFGEMAYITERAGGLRATESVIALIDQLPLDVVPADRSQTLAAARIKAAHPLSFADAFAAALAQAHGATVVTGDPEFKAVDGLVKVEWLPR